MTTALDLTVQGLLLALVLVSVLVNPSGHGASLYKAVLVFPNFCKILVCVLTLKLPMETSLSVVPKLPVSLRSGENCENFRKTNTPLIYDG